MICDNCTKQIICKFTELCKQAEETTKMESKGQYSPFKINLTCEQYEGKLTSIHFSNRTYTATTTGDPNPTYTFTTSTVPTMCDPTKVNRRDYYDNDDDDLK